MKKIGVTTIIDLETGEYELRFQNVSNKGEPMDYYEVLNALIKVVRDWERQVDSLGPNSDENILKNIN